MCVRGVTILLWLAVAITSYTAPVEDLVERVRSLDDRQVIAREPTPLVLANGTQAATAVLLHTTWQLKHVPQSSELSRGLAADALRLPEEERLKLMNRFDDYTQLWWVPLNSARVPGNPTKELLEPAYSLTHRYHRELVWLGEAEGFSWYAYMPIYEWIQLRKSIELKHGDDVLAGATRGLGIEDQGNMTANSVEGFLIGAGPAAIPYMKATLTAPHFDRALRVLGMIADPQAFALLMTSSQSTNQNLARVARHVLVHNVRPEAEELYFEWLGSDIGKAPVFQLLQACAKVNKLRLNPFLPRILSTPKSRFEFRHAFELSRELSDQGIPPDLLQAEEQIKTHGSRGNHNYDEPKVNAAVTLLSTASDVEAAAHLAISLACAVTKGDWRPVNDAGISILSQLPQSQARPLVQALVAHCDDAWTRNQLRKLN